MKKLSKGKKILAAVLSAVLAGSLVAMPAAAYADVDLTSSIPTTAQSTDNLVTGAATRAAQPSLEILGVASIEESGQFIDLTTDENGKYTGIYSYDQPKYYLAASTLNTSLSPYLANFAIGEGTQAVYNASRSGSGNGPNQALSTETDPDEEDYDVEDLKILAMNPDVIVGNGGDDTSSAIKYSASNYSELCETMYAIAEAADSAATGAKKLRYSTSATDIATAYEQYIFGTMGAVKQALDSTESGSVSMRSVVLVEDAWQDEDGTWYFDLMTEEEARTSDGTAAQNRYLETTVYTGIKLASGDELKLANNYADEIKFEVEDEGAEESEASGVSGVSEESEESDEAASKMTNATATAAQLSANVDLIMVGGQQSSSNYDDIMDALVASSLLGKTYFVKDNGSAGAQYGVVMNSVENAQNVGRILGYLYPEVVSQQSWLAYYYEEFYHISTSSLADVMNTLLDGVRCWNVTNPGNVTDAVEWEISELSGYATNFAKSTVESTISSGWTYLKSIMSTNSSN